MLFAYTISMLPSSAPNSRRDNVLQLPTKNFAKKTKLYAFAMRRPHSAVSFFADQRLCFAYRSTKPVRIKVPPAKVHHAGDWYVGSLCHAQ